MTNNIEKLYELAGVEKRIFSAVIQGEFPHRIHDRCYPPFTAEKQLNLIKWLAKLGEFEFCLEIAHNSFDVFTFYFNGIRVHDSFEEALAGLVCELWDDLTDEQREEVRGILQ